MTSSISGRCDRYSASDEGVSAMDRGVAADYDESPTLLTTELANPCRRPSTGDSETPMLEITAVPRTHLTRRERQVIDAIVRGRTNLEIARDLEISEQTVKN